MTETDGMVGSAAFSTGVAVSIFLTWSAAAAWVEACVVRCKTGRPELMRGTPVWGRVRGEEAKKKGRHGREGKDEGEGRFVR